MDVDMDLMSRIHKEQKQRKHKRAQSDQSASPMDWFYNPDATEDANLLVIPDTPSPVFNGRKTKVKFTGKMTSSVSAPEVYDHRIPSGNCDVSSSISPDFAAKNLKCEADSEDSAAIDCHHSNIRLTDVLPMKGELSSRLKKKRRSHENGMANMDYVASDESIQIEYHHGSIRLTEVSPPKKVESISRLKKRRSHENGITSGTTDITNCSELVDSHSTDVDYVEDTNDVLILSSEGVGSSKSAICGSECPRNNSGSNRTSCKHSRKKLLFPNGTRKRELVETDTLRSVIVSQSVSSHDKHSNKHKQRTIGECSPLKRCISSDHHSKSSRLKTSVPSSCRFTGRTEILPSSTQSRFTSPPSSLSEKSFLHRKHHAKSHHRIHKSGTSSIFSNCDSLSAAASGAKVHPCEKKQRTSRDTDGMTCFPSFMPASLIDLTKTTAPKHEMRSWKSPPFCVTNDVSPMERHKCSHKREHTREKRKSIGSDAKTAHVLSQLEQDETMARRLQEEMDHDFALALAESENRTTADSSTSHSDLPRDLAGLDQVISDLEMSASSVIDYGPIHVRSRGACACVNVTETGTVVSVGFTANTRPPGGRRRRGGGRHRHQVVYYEPEQNDGNDYEFLLGLAEQIGDATSSAGLCKQHIDLLPQRLYSGQQAGRDSSCNICMCDYETGDNLRMLPCFHEFHQSCIDTWIQKNATCPICRVDIEVGQS